MAAIVLRVVISVVASLIWASTGQAGIELTDEVASFLLPGVTAVAILLVECLALFVVMLGGITLIRRRLRSDESHPALPPQRVEPTHVPGASHPRRRPPARYRRVRRR
jgi:hypothetical protein